MAVTNIKAIPNNQVRNRNKIEQHEHCDVADARRTTLVSPDGLLKVDVITDNLGVHRLAVDTAINVENLNVDILNPTTPKIINHLVATANVEFAILLPDKTKRYKIQVREGNAKLRLAFESTKTTTEYITIKYGNEWDSGDIDLPDNTSIYLQSDKANVVIEIQPWLLL